MRLRIIHGYPLDSFLDLLKKADFNPRITYLYVIGDVIDRNGDGGIAMLLRLDDPAEFYGIGLCAIIALKKCR